MKNKDIWLMVAGLMILTLLAVSCYSAPAAPTTPAAPSTPPAAPTTPAAPSIPPAAPATPTTPTAPSTPPAAPVTPPAAPTIPTTPTSVDISGFAFSPATITIAAGTTVTWTNKDSVPHTVTSKGTLFNSPDLSRGATFSYTFNQKGTFDYHCAIHPYMNGKVVVE